MGLVRARTDIARGIGEALGITWHPWPKESVEAPCVVVLAGPGKYLERGEEFCGNRARWTALIITGGHWSQEGFDAFDGWLDGLVPVLDALEVDGVEGCLEWQGTESPTQLVIGNGTYLAVEISLSATLKESS